MSEARHGRFEIDIDEIERQLRQSVSMSPEPRPDPLAELARIVGQNDPFRGILERGRPDDEGHAPSLDAGGDAHGYAQPYSDAAGDELFDPVGHAYGSPEAALDQYDMQPLRRRRSRAPLAITVVAILAVAGGVGGVLVWRGKGGGLLASGAPPVIAANTAPLKVAPENPGGIEVPNQDRQIYEKGAGDTGQSRVVDGREQPVDVREAARTMPTVSARVSSPPDSGGEGAGTGAPARPGGRGAIVNALGEPRRVQTVSVRPDGTIYTPDGSAPASAPADPLLPGGTPPNAVPVTTVAVNTRTAAVAAPPASAPPAGTASTAPASAPLGPAVSVLPPARPHFDRVAARTDETPARDTAATARRYSVEVAAKPTEEEARTTFAQLLDKYPSEIEGRPAQVTEAKVSGKTVHRVRIGPMAKDEADGLCSRLKAAGARCFVPLPAN